jgi:hypothetical protein
MIEVAPNAMVTTTATPTKGSQARTANAAPAAAAEIAVHAV